MDKKLINEKFLSGSEIFSTIEDLCRYPHRRTGSKESAAAAEYIKERFKEAGLADVHFEETEAVNFDASDWFLKVNDKDIDCFMINGTLHPEPFGCFETGEECIGKELVYLGEGRAEDFENADIRGKIVLCDCPWFDSDEEVYATKWCREGSVTYDPDKSSRPVLRKTDSYSPNTWPYNYITAQQKGAAGFIGVLNDYFDDGINWNEDYSEIALSCGCKAFEIPGLWIGTKAMKQVKSLLKENKAKVSMGLKTRYRKGMARNVVGVLEGMTDDTIIVHSHHDAVFTGAVQDASGMAEVIALAGYFGSIPKEQRKKTIVFAALDGHYTDYAGHRDFVKKILDKGKNIVCDVVIEHIGKEVGLDKDNRPVVSDEPEIRLIYVTDIKDRVNTVTSLVKSEDIRRTVIMPVELKKHDEDTVYEFEQDEVISDAYYSSCAGIPVISMLSPQMYLFHPMDTPEMVPQKELKPVGVTFAQIIHYLMEEE